MVVVNLDNIDENTRIMRVVDENALTLSIGNAHFNECEISFPLNFLDYYQRCEDASRRDENETGIFVNVNGVRCAVQTCVPAMISCWTLIDDNFDPHSIASNSKLIEAGKKGFIIISTIAKVKKMVQEIVNMIKQIQIRSAIGSNGLIFNAVCGKVDYYPLSGIANVDWQAKINSIGIDIPVIEPIFHKELRFSDQNEYRFAILFNNFMIPSSLQSSMMSTIPIIRSFKYPKIIIKDAHYIDKIYALPNVLTDFNISQARKNNIDVQYLHNIIECI